MRYIQMRPVAQRGSDGRTCLFHGLGFASGLLTLMQPLPASTALGEIVGFSLGVEVGHQLIMLPFFGLLKALRYAQRNAPTAELL